MNLAERDNDFAHAATEYVSKYIRMLAVGVMVLGVAFAVLDRCQLLPRLPEVAAVATTAAVSADQSQSVRN
jgi:hypothetical protein